MAERRRQLAGERAMKLARIDREPEGPLAKLQRVLHVKNTSHESLRQIMRDILPAAEMPSSRMMTYISQARFSAVRAEIELDLTAGGTTSWELADPNLLLTRILEECPALQEAFAVALRLHPCSAEHPWGLLLGWDENVPGNKPALQNYRKSMNASFSFAELGPALSHDACWFTPIVVLATKIKLVSGTN